jgi:hypothetical protein
MPWPRNVVVLRFLGASAAAVVVVVVAVLSKPEWLEYFAEVGSILVVVFAVRMIVDKTRGRFRVERASPFEGALRREVRSQQTPSQLLQAISMAVSPEKSTFDLLSGEVERRLYDRYGFGLNDEKSRGVLGPEMYDLLQLERRPGPSWALRKRSTGWQARTRSVARAARRSVVTSQHSPELRRSASVAQAQAILNSLEQL